MGQDASWKSRAMQFVGVVACATCFPLTFFTTLSDAPLRQEEAGFVDWKLVNVPAGQMPSTWLEAIGVRVTVAPL